MGFCEHTNREHIGVLFFFFFSVATVIRYVSNGGKKTTGVWGVIVVTEICFGVGASIIQPILP